MTAPGRRGLAGPCGLAGPGGSDGRGRSDSPGGSDGPGGPVRHPGLPREDMPSAREVGEAGLRRQQNRAAPGQREFARRLDRGGQQVGGQAHLLPLQRVAIGRVAGSGQRCRDRHRREPFDQCGARRACAVPPALAVADAQQPSGHGTGPAWSCDSISHSPLLRRISVPQVTSGHCGKACSSMQRSRSASRWPAAVQGSAASR